MNRKIKKLLIVFAGCAAAIVLTALIFVRLFNINTYRPGIEAAISEATGMEVRVNGDAKLTLFPLPGVSLENILIQNRGADVVSAEKMEIEIRLLPLFRREVLARQVRMISPGFFITKDRSGRLNVGPGPDEKRPAEEERLPEPPDVKKIFIEKGHLLYTDEKSGGSTEANECDLEIENLSAGGEKFPVSLSLDGDFSCMEVKARDFRTSEVHAVIKAREGRFEANPVTMKIFGGEGKGSINFVAGKSPEYLVDFAITKLRFEEVLGAFGEKKSIRGEMELISHLTMKGKNADEMKRTAQGELSLRGKDLMHESLDLDRMLEKYKTSQNFNLIDIGAVFVAGPLGPLLTKSYDFGRFYVASLGGKSKIRELVSDWKINDGVAETKDVAFTTNRNRIALQGKIDLIHDRFDNMTVAALDEKGCVRFGQKIYGPFNRPRFARISTLRSIVGPVFSLLEDTQKLLKGGECEVFYAGSVQHPK
ncbi:MAG: AsmA family protein [Nitrospiraceae bacterium]|nr:MAG: AsmA family protein [Nitrospiraceae bacterium]